jgi:gamma-butyrobetaine dioxygenase
MPSRHATMFTRLLFMGAEHVQNDSVRLAEQVGSPGGSPWVQRRAFASAGRLHVTIDGVDRVFQAQWLLDRSFDPLDIDPVNRQRTFEPIDVPADLAVVGVDARTLGMLSVEFSDGRTRTFEVGDLRRAIDDDIEAPPPPRAWAALDTPPTITWADVCERPDRLLDVVGAFHEVGCFVITGAPVAPGALEAIAGRFGRVSATSFGAVFDVRSIPVPDDLAYTAVGLSAHLDQPYRRPTPGLQFLHVLVNDAPGGESIVADGLAAVAALRDHDPTWYATLCELEVEFRYDIGTDVVVATAPMIDLRGDGSLRQFRFSPRVDFARYADPEVLDRFYAARRWLAAWLDDPAHHLEFKMDAGDVLVVDNHRVLHGRRPFDPTVGHRHLQGCYIDHDGPETMWRLLMRRAATA